MTGRKTGGRPGWTRTPVLLLLRLLRSFYWRVLPRLNRSLAQPSPQHPSWSHEGMKTARAFFLALDLPASARAYLRTHLDRLCRTVLLTPPGGDRVLELATYMQLLPAVSVMRGYEKALGNYLAPPGESERRRITAGGEMLLECQLDLFDVEKDRFPYDDNVFDTVLACELLEHLNRDPLHMLIEAHRVLKPNGMLVLTTPNAASWTSLQSTLHGTSNPYLFSQFPDPTKSNNEAGLRHVREFTAHEVAQVLTSAGFEVETLITQDTGNPAVRSWVEPFLLLIGLPTVDRGEQIYCLARKLADSTPVRLPSFLYVCT